MKKFNKIFSYIAGICVLGVVIIVLLSVLNYKKNPDKIALLGDSVLADPLLMHYLDEKNYGDHFQFYNYSVSGIKSEDLLNHIVNATNLPKFKVAFIMIGFNDDTVGRTLHNVMELKNYLKMRGTQRVVYVSLYHCEQHLTLVKYSEEFNRRTEFQDGVVRMSVMKHDNYYADDMIWLRDIINKGVTYDGLHLNDIGLEMLANEFLDYIGAFDIPVINNNPGREEQ